MRRYSQMISVKESTTIAAELFPGETENDGVLLNP